MAYREPFSKGAIVGFSLGGVLLFFGMIALALAGCPNYRVYAAGKEGQAQLRKAEQNRQIKVLEAKAKLESAKLEAEAEVERAKGVAQANAIVADGLKGHDEYLRYLWIDKVSGQSQREIIYVPTEANMPILEATRLGPPARYDGKTTD